MQLIARTELATELKSNCNAVEKWLKWKTLTPDSSDSAGSLFGERPLAEEIQHEMKFREEQGGILDRINKINRIGEEGGFRFAGSRRAPRDGAPLG